MTDKQETPVASTAETKQGLDVDVTDEAGYRGKQLFVEASYDGPKLYIDGKPVEVNRDPDSGAFGAGELPYRAFESVEELGKALLDD